MHFGESLVRLKSDIRAGYNEREAVASARALTLSCLRADVQKALAQNEAQRAELAKSLAHAASVLHEKLAADNAALSQAVQQKRAADKVSLAEARDKIDSDAKALRASLSAFRRQSVADVSDFRAGVRAARSESAAKLAEDLKAFVAGVKAKSNEVRQAVQQQRALIHESWGQYEPVLAKKTELVVETAPPVQVSLEEKNEPVPDAALPLSEAQFSITVKETSRGRKRDNARAIFTEGEDGFESPYSAGQTE